MPMTTLLIFIITWNVAQKPPPEDLTTLLNIPPKEKYPDLYIVGLQEIKYFSENWKNAFTEVLEKQGYKKKTSIRLHKVSGIMIQLFVSKVHIRSITKVEARTTATGFFSMWGNKGATTIRLNLYGKSTCFVNAHLAPHEGHASERLEQVNHIQFDQEFSKTEDKHIFDSKLIFWFGDLNFRLQDEPGVKNEEIVGHINKNHLDILRSKDELFNLMKVGEYFKNFKEYQVNFNPTFKFMPKSNNYNTKRRPAWTDRILYRGSEKVQVKPIKYESVPSYQESDHKPVIALFEVQINSEDVMESELQEKGLESENGSISVNEST